MPPGDPLPSIQKVLDADFRLRRGEGIDADQWGVSPYWADLIRLLQVFAVRKNRSKLQALKARMAFERYGPYIDGPRVRSRRTRSVRNAPPPPRQLPLPL
jgi:thymidylate synthase